MSTFAPSSSSASIAELIGLTGKTVIVTGGAMGIGDGIARRLHEAGAAVLIEDLDPGAAEAASSSLNARRVDSSLWTATDVSDAEAVAAMVSAAVQVVADGGILLM
ncbi:MAG: SDR family NAD(P)-dependent oxidoreductase [Solirubrobacteraceae bacterium]